MEKWIRVYASNTNSESLWNVETRQPIDPATLPISAALRLRLAEWTDRWWYEHPEKNVATLEAFAAQGLSIAKALKSELPHYIVNYYDEAAAARNTEDDIPRDDHADPWDYEITL